MRMSHSSFLDTTAAVSYSCPLTNGRFLDPVTCPDSFHFERTALIATLKTTGGKHPFTGRPLKMADMVPNQALQSAARYSSTATETYSGMKVGKSLPKTGTEVTNPVDEDEQSASTETNPNGKVEQESVETGLRERTHQRSVVHSLQSTLFSLEKLIREQSLQGSANTGKLVDVLALSAQATWIMNGGRAVSCKSGKDRTAMA